MSDEKYIEITLVTTTEYENVVLSKILHSTNTYLLRNKGAVSDFNLIKDVVERNCDAVDDEINTQLPIPLYLGLMGTMLGIIVGLFFMPPFNTATTNAIGDGIDVLIGGVKIAMIAGFVGLLFTVIASGFMYKGAKAKAESQKNDFYTFIQTDLLPVLSQNVTSSIYSLQTNLLKFNDTFSGNVNRFDGFLKEIYASFESQLLVLEELKNIDVAALAKLNVNVLRELRTSTKEFERFNHYLQQVNTFVDNAQKLNYQISTQLDRTHAIEEVASSIGVNVQLNRELIDLLQSDLREVDTRKQLFANAVVDVDQAISKSLEELKRHIDAQIEAIRNVTIKEEDLLEKLLKEDRGNLDELKRLSDISDKLSEAVVANRHQNKLLDTLNESIRQLPVSHAPQSPVIPNDKFSQYSFYGILGFGAVLLGGFGYLGYIIYKLVLWISHTA